MKRKLPPWCKQAKIRLVEMDMTVSDLATKVGLSREYTSALIHGRVYSEPAMKSISDILNIPDTACPLL